MIGVIDGPGPTVLRYGMYDVQPPGARWTVEPFGAELRDGRIVARGAANSKGALAAAHPRVRVRAEPVPPGVRVRGRGGARQPAARRLLRRPPRRADRRLRARLRPAGAARARCSPACGPVRDRAARGRRARRALLARRRGARAGDRPRARDARAQAGGAGGERTLDARRHARGRQPHGGARARRAPASTSASTSALEPARDDGRGRAGAQGHLPGRAAPDPTARRCARWPRRCAATGTEPRVLPGRRGGLRTTCSARPFASGGPGSAGGAHGPDEWAEVEGLRRLMHVVVRRAGRCYEAALRGAHLARAARARAPRRPRRRRSPRPRSRTTATTCRSTPTPAW